MPRYPLTLLDVFAIRPLEGNLLAVIHDADDVATGTMQTLARRFNLAETSFIQTATDPGATYRHRIFTVSEELPFAGHPSIGTAVAWAYRAGDTDCPLCAANSVRIAGALGRARRPSCHRQAATEPGRLWRRDRFDARSCARWGCMRRMRMRPCRRRSPPPDCATTVVPLRDPAALKRIAVDWPAFRAALGEGEARTHRAQLLRRGRGCPRALGGAHVRRRYSGWGRRRDRLGGGSLWRVSARAARSGIGFDRSGRRDGESQPARGRSDRRHCDQRQCLADQHRRDRPAECVAIAGSDQQSAVSTKCGDCPQSLLDRASAIGRGNPVVALVGATIAAIRQPGCEN